MSQKFKLSVFIVLLTMLATACFSQITNKYGLVIGIKGYPYYPAGQKLKFADKDAMMFASFLKTKEGGLFQPENISLLINENATKENIQKKIKWLKTTCNYDNLLYIYFCGHGLVDNDNAGYLMPYDANPKSPKDKGILVNDFVQVLKDSLNVQSVITFIDASFPDSTYYCKQLNEDRKHDINIVNQFNNKWNELFLNKKEVRMSFLSTSPGEYSFEHETLNGGHGIFTYFLIEGLQGAADGINDLNNIITAQELHRYVTTRVSTYVLSRLSESQHPVCTPNFKENYPMGVVKFIDFSDRKTIDFSRISVRIKGNSSEKRDFVDHVEKNIALILKAMNKKDISTLEIREACTDIGYQNLTNIVEKTNPNPDRIFYPIRLLETTDSSYCQVRDVTVFVEKGGTYDLLPLCFGIKKPSGKIDQIFFTSPPQKLRGANLDSLLSSADITPQIQEKMMHFLSKYMTSYYLKDIDFIEKMYSDEALIIVGNVIRTTKTNAFIDEKIKYFIKTKPEYIQSLKKVFDRDSFIKLEFNNILTEKHHLKNFYGVTLKQLWYAKHYWDEGYLFLLFEFDEKDPDKFTLHVRAWQDDELDQGPLIGVHSVNFITEVDTTTEKKSKEPSN